MIGEASSQSRRTRRKAGATGICSHLQAQGSQRTTKIGESIFPPAGRFQQAELLGKRQGFANQAPIHLPRGQRGPFDRGRLSTKGRFHFFWVSRDDLDLHMDQSTASSLFDPLEGLPVFAWLGVGCWSA